MAQGLVGLALSSIVDEALWRGGQPVGWVLGHGGLEVSLCVVGLSSISRVSSPSRPHDNPLESCINVVAGVRPVQQFGSFGGLASGFRSGHTGETGFTFRGARRARATFAAPVPYMA